MEATETATKRCNKCHRIKPLDAYWKNLRNAKDHKENKCIQCYTEERNTPEYKGKKREDNKNFREQNPDYGKQWQEENKEERKQYQHDRYLEQKETIPDFMENNRLKTAEQRLKPEVQEREQQYRASNAVSSRINSSNASDKRKGLDNDMTDENIAILSKKQNGINRYTNTLIRFVTIVGSGKNTGDHFSSSIDRIDSSLGHTEDNVQIIELWLNRMKNNSEPEDFEAVLRQIMVSKTIADYSIQFGIEFPKCYESLVYYQNYRTCILKNELRKNGPPLIKLIRNNISDTFDNLYFNTKNSQLKYYQKELDFDKTYLEELMIKQNFRCSITGIPCNLYANNPYKFSIDRIDSNLPYSKDNIHLVCECINLAKSDMDLDTFKKTLVRLQLELLKSLFG